jgi:hypothetical protein
MSKSEGRGSIAWPASDFCIRHSSFDIRDLFFSFVLFVSFVVQATALAARQATPASAPAGPPAAPPPGPRVWVGDIHDIQDRDLGREAKLAIVGARNGAFSAKVVVDSPSPIVGLKAAVSELKPSTAGAAAIPASAVRLRYGSRWDASFPWWLRDWRADILLDRPPAEVPIGEGNRARGTVWVTLSVPKDAAPGAYVGRLTVEAKGIGPVQLPVSLEVAGWTLPDPQDYRTWCEIIQSPDTLAVEYGVPLWSPRHWELIARSFDSLAPTGSRVVHVPLIARTNLGNEESMVRWVRKDGNRYEFDFTNMEKYLDLAQKHLGRPKIVIFWVWDIALKPEPRDMKFEANMPEYMRDQIEAGAARHALIGKGPPVTVWDEAARKTETVRLGRYEDPAARALWRPLWEELRKRMKARGLEKEMMLGMASDHWPTKEEVLALKDLSGGLPWASSSHAAAWMAYGGGTGKDALQGVGTIAYSATKLQREYVINPARARSYGWRKPMLHATMRLGWPVPTMASIRQEAECDITGNQRGIGHQGGDFWPAVRGKGSARTGTVTDRFPESFWRSLNISNSFLAPGPDGPLGTGRLEVFREGLQECEARVAIETALLDENLKAKLGAELAGRAQAMLDERHRCLWLARGAKEADLDKPGLVTDYREFDYGVAKGWSGPAGLNWFLSSGWQGRSAKLFAIAGEVAAKLAAK